MTVLIDIRTEGFPEELEAVMEKIALDSLKYEGFQEECEISISIVDNEEIHQINKTISRYRPPHRCAELSPADI